MKSNKHLPGEFLIFLSILYSFWSCETEVMPITSLEGNDRSNHAEKVNILNEDVADYIENKILDQDTALIFNQNMPDDKIPEEDEVIFIPVTEKTPYGFLGKVKSVKQEGTIKKILTETASLDEIFENLAVDTTFSIVNELLGCYDENGNPIDYEIIEEEEEIRVQSRAGGYSENLNSINIKIPFSLHDGDYLNLTGSISINLDNISFGININNFHLDYFNFTISPGLGLDVTSKAFIKTPENWEKSKLICSQIFAPVTIPTPGIPIILRPKIYLFLVYGANGELSVTSKIQYRCSSTYGLKCQNSNWSYISKNNNLTNKDPWLVSEIELNGELHIADKIGFLCGLYSATTGFGINIVPMLKAKSNFKFSFNDLMLKNPQVQFSASIMSELYFTAAIFGKKIAHYSVYTPEYIAWSEKIFLLPQIINFSASGEGASGGIISYQVDSHSLLGQLGAKPGFGLYDSSERLIRKTNSPADVMPDKKGIYSYNTEVDHLEQGQDYFASPAVTFMDYEWFGEKTKFTTEGIYTLYFRCASQTYDVVVFSFSLSNTSGNVINITQEATDYNGTLMRININADYNRATAELSGTFDFYFYDDPEQKRIDGFTVSLANDDSGYVGTTKIIDNGGCAAAIRIARDVSQNRLLIKSYEGVRISEDDCDEGFSVIRRK